MFLYHQKWKKNRCNFYCFFKIPLNNYNDDEKCLLNKAQIFFFMFFSFCKIVTFLNFEDAAFKNAIIYLKRQQFVTKLRQQIKDERIRWEEKKKTVKVFEDYLNNSLYSCK